ncbi:MAG: endonuclease III [Bacteroidia bacterium]|nr:endonuclease III [Bacteroidia bacterium]
MSKSVVEKESYSLASKKQIKEIFSYFRENVPVAESELNYENPYQLMVAVILSAQCTDKRVNMHTPAFFVRFPDAQSLSVATFEEVFNLIKSISFPNNKAKHLLGMAKMLVQDHNGEVPSEREKLEKLPGVGRKTANVVASIIFNKPYIAVDTHVFRVSHRMGLSLGKTPLEVEEDLNKIVPVSERAIAHHWLILHGRYICTARNPKCNVCPVAKSCNFSKVQ